MPFTEPETGALDFQEILSESIPLAKLIGLFGGLSLVPFSLVFLTFDSSAVGGLMVVLGQFILAVGAGVVLMYVIARGSQLSGE